MLASISVSKLNHKNNEPQETFQNGKSLIKRQNQTTKHIKPMDINCNIPDLVQAFLNVENGELNFGSSMLFNFVLVWLYNYFDMY